MADLDCLPIRPIDGGSARRPRGIPDNHPADLIHDLMQPLAGILALTDLPPAREPSGDGHTRISQVRALAEWMQGLLASAQTSAPDGRQRGTGNDLPTDARDVCRVVATALAHRTHALTIAGPDAPLPVDVDRVVLRRIVANVVDNAARAAGPDGRVEVRVSNVNNSARIVVTDDGPGFGCIPGNTGLGLRITRRLLKACSGSLMISDSPRGGAEVTISIPLAIRAGHQLIS